MAERSISTMALALTMALLVQTASEAGGGQPLTPGEVHETLRPPTSFPSFEGAPVLTLPKASVPKPEPASERRVKVEHFVITGNTIFSEAELNTVLADLAGTELSLTEIYGAADRLTAYYQQRGYSLTSVTVPAQRLRDGILRLEVVEGRVGKLLFTGSDRYSEATLKKHVQPIVPETIIRLSDLEREVLLLNDLPGLMARSTIAPGEAYGTSDIQFKVEEVPFSASATVDNQGPKVIGQWRLGADFTINNPGKFGDALSFGYTHSESSLLRQGRIKYDIPVNHNGTRLALNYSRAEYDVSGDFAALDINGVSESARLQLNHPLIRSRSRNLVGSVSLARIVGQTDYGELPLNDLKEDVNFVEAGLSYNCRNATGGWSSVSAMVSTNFRNNLDGSDGSALPPNLKINASHEHLLGGGWSAALLGEAQLSADSMPDSHKYTLGGPQKVRGFTVSDRRGDQGGGDQGGVETFELRRALRLGKANLLLRGFVDAGAVFYHRPLVNGSSSATLASAGAGAHVQLPGKCSMDLVWAKPIDGKDSGEGHNARVWMTLTASY